MERNITEKLIEWRNAKTRKPLVLQGVRQCGKTYTLKEFGKTHFRNCLYYNFEKETSLADVFNYDFDCNRILNELAIYKGIEKIDLRETLIIFDEVQECSKALTSLKYFCEDYPEMYIAAAGSLLGPVIAHRNISFPVGKVEFLTMYPMSFEEFLRANGYDKELSLIRSFDTFRAIPESIAERLKKACKQYYIIGGMPEAVVKWIETHNLDSVDKVLDDILTSYSNDFGKYLDPVEALKVTWIWDSIPVQLAKENNKFVFSHVKEGKRAAQLEDSLQWLDKAGLIYRLELVSNPGLPLSFYVDATYFKVYMSDVGLLRRKSGLSYDTILDETQLYTTFKGALTENYVMNELIKQGHKPYFWRSSNTAEVDFIIESTERVIPIESKAENNTKAKSFRLFCQRYNPSIGFILSMNNIGDNRIDNTTAISLPLYCLWQLDRYLS